MARKLALAVLFCLLFATLTACPATPDAAREAGERAAGEGPEGPDAGKGDPETAGEETPAAPTASETTGETEPTEVAAETTTSDHVLDPKWYKDSDGNIVPDFIEVEEGYDPKKDDCVQKGCPGAADGVDARFYTEERNTLLVLDSSGSMAADDGTGRTKMEAAKEAVERYAGVSAAVSRTGFMVFGQAGEATEAGRAESCAAPAETLLPIGEADAGGVSDVLPRFGPAGWTPIEGALDRAEDAFAGAEGQYNRVILVSDGAETCGGDPAAAARRLNAAGIGLEVDVVGLGVPGEEADRLRRIATAGGGEYFDAGTGADLDGYFREQSEALDRTLESANCFLDSANAAKSCDLELCNAAAINHIRPEQAKYGVASPEQLAFEDLYNDIQAGYAEREKVYEETYRKADELRREFQAMHREYTSAVLAAYGN